MTDYVSLLTNMGGVENMREYRANVTSEMTQLERENGQIVRELAGECMVILENDGILPLKGTCRVAL